MDEINGKDSRVSFRSYTELCKCRALVTSLSFDRGISFVVCLIFKIKQGAFHTSALND